MAEVTVTYTAQVPRDTVGLQVTVECSTCTSQQRNALRPMVCGFIGSRPSTVPNQPLVACPNAQSR